MPVSRPAVLAMKLGPFATAIGLALGGPSPAAETASPAAGAPPPWAAAAEERARSIASGLRACAARAAALPESRAALKGDRSALPGLFGALEDARSCDTGRPALAVRPNVLTTLAWSGRIGETGFAPGVAGGDSLLVSAGSLSTTFVAIAPIVEGSGRTLGFATAERTVSVRRRIQNEFLRDFDLVAAGDPSLELRYVDSRDADDPTVIGALQPGEVLLRSTGGTPIAIAGTTSAREDGVALASAESIRLGAAAVLGAALLLATARAASRGAWSAAAGGLLALRCALLLLPSVPSRFGGLLSPEVYSAAFPGPWGLLDPFLGSPLALFASILTAFLLAALAAGRAFQGPPGVSSGPKRIAAVLLALPVLAGVFLFIGDTTQRCSLDIESISPVPKSLAHLVMQWSALLTLATGALVIALLARWSGATLGAALSGATWREARGATRTAGARAGLGLAAVGALAVLLHPTLMHFAEKTVRGRIQREYAAAVLRQPEWRERVLARTQEQIDALDLLEDVPSGPGLPPLVDELAFATWSGTELASFGFSSAVEIQDPSGAVLSRFALNLPVISGPDKPLPSTEAWQAGAERLSLASAERRVLHARRLLIYHGRTHGAVHVYVGTDFWNLSFLSSRDPYSILYRTGSRQPGRDRPVDLVAFGRNRDLLFTSADHPPAFDAALFDRAASGPFWTTLTEPEGAQRTYVFADANTVYGLTYSPVSTGRFAAQLVEAVTGMVVSAAIALLLVSLVRTMLGRRTLSWASAAAAIRERFAVRIFVAFIAVAVVPVVVLELVVRRVVADRLHRDAENQALERAAIARKAVEDFALFQRGESPGRQPVTDAALVWVASLIRNDLDVFERGRLLASSKRELYASGLLAPRVSGPVFRALALDGQVSAVGTERIGDFSYMVVSVPVRLAAGETGILSIPLALKQRDVEAVLADLDHAIRLTSILFVVAAAALAQSMARRISGPVRDLTEAARSIARGELEARVSATSQDEFQHLVESFNRMAGDLERQRADLERSNRLAAWAEMARQVAHEVKNPLTPIQLSAEHLRRVYSDAGVDFATTLASCTETILAQVQKLRGIVTEFSAFARPAAGTGELIQMAELAAEAVEPYVRVLPPGVTLTTDLDGAGGPPFVRGDRRLLERALVNLVENALQAVGERGAVSLRVAVRADGAAVEIEVTDSGPGLDSEARARAFEPFFSTKTGGSGLGLALVRKIAEEHGGGASLNGHPGRTVATLWLPAAAPPAEAHLL